MSEALDWEPVLLELTIPTSGFTFARARLFPDGWVQLPEVASADRVQTEWTLAAWQTTGALTAELLDVLACAGLVSKRRLLPKLGRASAGGFESDGPQGQERRPLIGAQ